MHRPPHTARDAGWIALGTNRILHGLYVWPTLDLALRIGHVHGRVWNFTERHLLYVCNYSHDRPHRIPGCLNTHLLANGILTRPEFLRHCAVDNGHSHSIKGVGIRNIAPAQGRAKGAEITWGT